MPTIQLESFIPGDILHRQMFEQLNREWLDEYGFLEPADEALFADPEGLIINQGGTIIFAKMDMRYIGAGALLAHENNICEIGKLAVTRTHRGKGIGRLITEALITAARQQGAHTITLSSNRKLKEAIALYRTLGFEETSTPDPRYASCDITMKMDVK